MISSLLLSGCPKRALLACGKRAALVTGPFCRSPSGRGLLSCLFLQRADPPSRAFAQGVLGNAGDDDGLGSLAAAAGDDYPSRFVKESVVLPRVDPVVWGRHHGKDGLLTRADFDHFEEHGFVTLNDVLPEDTLQDLTEDIKARGEEMEELLNATEEIKYSSGESRSGIYLSESKTRRLRSVYLTFRHIPLVNKLARYPPLLASIKQILDDDVYISQDRINFQAEFDGEGFHWHSDFEAWHSEDGLPKPRAVSVMFMLSRNIPQTGALMVMPGTHKVFVGNPTLKEPNLKGSFEGYYLPAPLNRTILKDYGERYGMAYCSGEPGTVVLTDPNIIHGSHSNISPQGRCNLFLVYNAVSNKPGKPYGGTPPRPEYLSVRDPEWQKPLTPCI